MAGNSADYHHRSIVRSMGLCAVSCAGVLMALSPVMAHAQSLKETLEITYQTNPQLKAQRAALRATDELAAQARAERRPTINGQVTYEASEGSFDLPNQGGPANPAADPAAGAGGFFGGISGAGTSGTDTAGIQYEQPLFKGFRAYNAIREADARIDAARAELISTEQQILAGSAAGYLQLVTAGERVRVSEASLTVLQKQKEAAQTRFDTGLSTRTDVAQAEARLASAEADLIGAKADLAAAQQNFKRIVGQSPGTLESDPLLPPLPGSVEEALTRAKLANPDLAQAKGRKEAAAYNVRVAKSFLSPSVSAVARYGITRNQFVDGDEGDNTSLTAQINVPLFQGGQTYSRIRQAKAAERAEQFLYVDAQRALNEQVATAWQRMQASRAAYEATRLAIAANELAFEGVVLENELGQRTTLDVLDSERELLSARLTSLQAKESYYLSAFAVLQLTGQLTAQELGLEVALYDAEANKQDVQSRWFGFGEGRTAE